MNTLDAMEKLVAEGKKGKKKPKCKGTESSPVGSPRQKAFCDRMCGHKKKNTKGKTKGDPDSCINQSLRRWKCRCASLEGMEQILKMADLQSSAQQVHAALKGVLMESGEVGPGLEGISNVISSALMLAGTDYIREQADEYAEQISEEAAESMEEDYQRLFTDATGAVRSALQPFVQQAAQLDQKHMGSESGWGQEMLPETEAAKNHNALMKLAQNKVDVQLGKVQIEPQEVGAPRRREVAVQAANTAVANAAQQAATQMGVKLVGVRYNQSLPGFSIVFDTSNLVRGTLQRLQQTTQQNLYRSGYNINVEAAQVG